MFSTAPPVLVRTTAVQGFETPIRTLPQLTEDWLKWATGRTGLVPVPLTEDVCGLPEALSVTVTVEEDVPTTEGLKLAVMVQDWFAPSDAEQVFA